MPEIEETNEMTYAGVLCAFEDTFVGDIIECVSTELGFSISIGTLYEVVDKDYGVVRVKADDGHILGYFYDRFIHTKGAEYAGD